MSFVPIVLGASPSRRWATPATEAFSLRAEPVPVAAPGRAGGGVPATRAALAGADLARGAAMMNPEPRRPSTTSARVVRLMAGLPRDGRARLFPITYVDRAAVEALVARYTERLAMTKDFHDHAVTAQPTLPIDDPQEHARDVIDAMRDLGTSTPEAEQALRGAGLGLQRTLNRIYGPARGVR